jgi:hypothetical protein
LYTNRRSRWTDGFRYYRSRVKRVPVELLNMLCIVDRARLVDVTPGRLVRSLVSTH